MKKIILSFSVLCALSLAFVACGGKPELKQTQAKVASVDLQGDTLYTMRATVDSDTLLFKLADAQYTNGIMLSGDSVTIHYIEGRGDTLRALIVNVLPKAPHYFDPKEHGDTLLTVPARQDTAKAVTPAQ